MTDSNNSIIPIISHELSGQNERCVNARDLHRFLQVGRDFSNWLKNRIEEYGFIENQDFRIFAKTGEKSRGRKAIEYYLTLEMAKELSMVERTEKGREARQYFIQCERIAKSLPEQNPTTHPDFLMIHKSVLRDTGRALVWMGDYGVTSQPYYGGAQPTFIEGVPVNRLNDQSERYYLVRYVGNTLDSQYLATEETITQHLNRQYPTLAVVNKAIMIERFGDIMHQISEFSGMFSTYTESSNRFMQATAHY